MKLGNMFQPNDPGFRRQVDQGQQGQTGQFSGWNGRRAGQPLHHQGDSRSQQNSGSGQAGWRDSFRPPTPRRSPKKSPGPRTPDCQTGNGDEVEPTQQINFTKREKELAREQQSPNKQTPEQALALAYKSCR